MGRRDQDRRKAAGCLLRGVLVVGLLVIAVALFATFYRGATPKVTVKSTLPGIGRRTPIEIRIDDPQRVAKVRVEVVQNNETKPVLEQAYQPRSQWSFGSAPPLVLKADVGRETVQGLRTGEATVRVTAERAGSLLRSPDPVTAEIKLPVRLAPPTLQVVSSFHYINQGGCETVVYRVGEGAIRDGVRSGDWWFPGFPMPGNDKQMRFAFYAIPYDTTDPSGVRLTAEDEVGNRAEANIVDKFTPRPMTTDTIQVTDAFMNKVVPEIMGQSPEVADQGDLLKNYVEINRELRKKNAATLKELGQKSEPKFLWTQPFLPMPNAKITAAFAQRRTYVYNDKPIDQEDHLGFDMASVTPRRRARLEQRQGGARPLLRDLRQRRGHRPRLSGSRASTATSPRSRSRRGTWCSAARSWGARARRVSRAATISTSPCSSRGSPSPRWSGGTRTGSRTAWHASWGRRCRTNHEGYSTSRSRDPIRLSVPQPFFSCKMRQTFVPRRAGSCPPPRSAKSLDASVGVAAH